MLSSSSQSEPVSFISANHDLHRLENPHYSNSLDITVYTLTNERTPKPRETARQGGHRISHSPLSTYDLGRLWCDLRVLCTSKPTRYCNGSCLVACDCYRLPHLSLVVRCDLGIFCLRCLGGCWCFWLQVPRMLVVLSVRHEGKKLRQAYHAGLSDFGDFVADFSRCSKHWGWRRLGSSSRKRSRTS